jgi:[CysO sulfur-carrier protein]-S-L-cysteine hydrolase
MAERSSPDCFLLPPEFLADIVAHARAGYPQEVCGIIAGRCGVAVALYRGRNISPTPNVAYELDHETLARQIDFEDAGLILAAIYHSHPHGPETPSPTDIAHAFYPDSVYLIASLAMFDRPVVRGFKITDRRAEEVAIIV